ncbi:glycosyltransferase, partial [Nostoc sp. NIES-2111]
PPDGGETLRKEPAFTAFPSLLDGRPALARTSPPVRARDTGSLVPGQSHRPRWFLDGWNIADERPLVYITFGTEAGTSAKTQAAYRTALQAVRDLPVRALLTTGPNMQPADLGPVPDNVAVERFVPQADVLSWCRAVLCHGGSGTLLGAAALGVPMVITPLFADQFANARNIEAAGAGIAVLDGDPASLSGALRRLLGDPAFQIAAAAVQDEMARMHSIDDAVDLMLHATA